jgi:hypothetical protein
MSREARRRSELAEQRALVREALRLWRGLPSAGHLTPSVRELRNLHPALRGIKDSVMNAILRPDILGVKVAPALYGQLAWRAVEQANALRFKLDCPRWLPPDAFPVTSERRTLIDELRIRGPARAGQMMGPTIAIYEYCTEGGPVAGEGAWRRTEQPNAETWVEAPTLTGHAEGQRAWVVPVPLPEDGVAWMTDARSCVGVEDAGPGWVAVTERPPGAAVCMIGAGVRIRAGTDVYEARERAHLLHVAAGQNLHVLDEHGVVIATVGPAQPLNDPRVCTVDGSLPDVSAYMSVHRRKVSVVREGTGSLRASATGLRLPGVRLFMSSPHDRSWIPHGDLRPWVDGRVSLADVSPGRYAITSGAEPGAGSDLVLVVPASTGLHWEVRGAARLASLRVESGFPAHWTGRDDTSVVEAPLTAEVTESLSIQVPETGLATRWHALTDFTDDDAPMALRFRIVGCSPGVRLGDVDVPPSIGHEELRNVWDLTATFTGPRGAQILVEAQRLHGPIVLLDRLLDSEGRAGPFELRGAVTAVAQAERKAFDIVFHVGDKEVGRTRYLPWKRTFIERPHEEARLVSLLEEGGAIAVTGPARSGRRWLVEHVLGRVAAERGWRRLPEYVLAPGRGIDHLLALAAAFGWSHGDDRLQEALLSPSLRFLDTTLDLTVTVLAGIPSCVWVVDISDGEPCARLGALLERLASSSARVIVVADRLDAWTAKRCIQLEPFGLQRAVEADGGADADVLHAMQALARPYDEDEGWLDADALRRLAGREAAEALPGNGRRWRARRTDVRREHLEALKKALPDTRNGPPHLSLETGRVALMLGASRFQPRLPLDDAAIAYIQLANAPYGRSMAMLEHVDPSHPARSAVEKVLEQRAHRFEQHADACYDAGEPLPKLGAAPPTRAHVCAQLEEHVLRRELDEAENVAVDALLRWPGDPALTALLWVRHRLAGEIRSEGWFDGDLEHVPPRVRGAIHAGDVLIAHGRAANTGIPQAWADVAVMMALMVRPARP